MKIPGRLTISGGFLILYLPLTAPAAPLLKKPNAVILDDSSPLIDFSI
jgi:hypothetical protein